MRASDGVDEAKDEEGGEDGIGLGEVETLGEASPFEAASELELADSDGTESARLLTLLLLAEPVGEGEVDSESLSAASSESECECAPLPLPFASPFACSPLPWLSLLSG